MRRRASRGGGVGSGCGLLPAPGGEQHLNQQDHRDADKHQLPVTGRFVLVRVDHQFPDDRVKMQVKRVNTSLSISSSVIPAVARIADKNRIRRCDMTINVRKQDQQIGGEYQKAKVTDNAYQ